MTTKIERMTKAQLLQMIDGIAHDRNCREAEAEKANDERRAAQLRENVANQRIDEMKKSNATIQAKIDRAKDAIYQELRIRFGADVANQYEADPRGWVSNKLMLDENPTVNILRHLHEILDA